MVTKMCVGSLSLRLVYFGNSYRMTLFFFPVGAAQHSRSTRPFDEMAEETGRFLQMGSTVAVHYGSCGTPSLYFSYRAIHKICCSAGHSSRHHHGERPSFSCSLRTIT